MLTGAFLYAAGLATAVFYFKRRPLPQPKADGFDKRYRDPQTGLLSARMVRKQATGEQGR